MQAEFCPPIDSSLLLALVSDLGANPSPAEEAVIRETLTAIAAQVEVEQLSVQLSLEDDGASRGAGSSLSEVDGQSADASGRGDETDSTSLISSVEAALEEWKRECGGSFSCCSMADQ